MTNNPETTVWLRIVIGLYLCIAPLSQRSGTNNLHHNVQYPEISNNHLLSPSGMVIFTNIIFQNDKWLASKWYTFYPFLMKKEFSFFFFKLLIKVQLVLSGAAHCKILRFSPPSALCVIFPDWSLNSSQSALHKACCLGSLWSRCMLFIEAVHFSYSSSIPEMPVQHQKTLLQRNTAQQTETVYLKMPPLPSIAVL